MIDLFWDIISCFKIMLGITSLSAVVGFGFAYGANMGKRYAEWLHD